MCILTGYFLTNMFCVSYTVRAIAFSWGVSIFFVAKPLFSFSSLSTINFCLFFFWSQKCPCPPSPHMKNNGFHLNWTYSHPMIEWSTFFMGHIFLGGYFSLAGYHEHTHRKVHQFLNRLKISEGARVGTEHYKEDKTRMPPGDAWLMLAWTLSSHIQTTWSDRIWIVGRFTPPTLHNNCFSEPFWCMSCHCLSFFSYLIHFRSYLLS